MSFQFEITLGNATGFGGVWKEQDVLDFLSDEICSKNRFYKKRKIFNFCIDSNLDELKECKAHAILGVCKRAILELWISTTPTNKNRSH